MRCETRLSVWLGVMIDKLTSGLILKTANVSLARESCWPVWIILTLNRFCCCAAAITGESLMISGRVPKTKVRFFFITDILTDGDIYFLLES